MAYYRNLGIVGYSRAGKDSVASRLHQRYGYQRVAFADPLRAAALRTDPLIPTSYGVHTRLSTLVHAVGWEYAKSTYPEVRRVLQTVGQTVRDMDPDFWVRAALPAIDAAHELGLPVVVSDVRYANEAQRLLDDDFRLIRVTRPGAGLSGDAGKHTSETELADWATDLTINNAGTLGDLNAIVDSLLLPRS